MLVTESNKTDCNPKISEIKKKITTDHDHDKYITTQKFNKLKVYCKTQTRKFSKQKWHC